jgi:hypothetical protein
MAGFTNRGILLMMRRTLTALPSLIVLACR